MNRIRELREARGLSQAALAAKVGTTQPTIDRLEKGDRRLTEDWMRKIADALAVSPADLILAPTVTEFREEATAYRPPEMEHLLAQLDMAGKVFMTITSDSVLNLGIKPGDVRLFDASQTATDAVRTGDVVIAQLYHPEPNVLEAVSVVRQFIAPGLLVTNRPGPNMAFEMVNPNFEAAIKMVMVPGKAGDPPPKRNGTTH
jgi:transcriptional regulator with XRE-family HTH domain